VRVFARTIGVMNALGTLWIFALMILINADVLARELAGAPLRGVAEIVSLSIVGIVFLELPHALWNGRLIRNDALLRRLAARRPGLACNLERVFALVGGFVFALLAAAGAGFFAKALRVGEYVGALGDFTVPTWPIRGIVVIGSAATAVAFAILAIGVGFAAPNAGRDGGPERE